MSNAARKATSPTRDALRILFRNPSAVLALVMIVLLAVTAMTGKLFTGARPTPEQLERIEEARELGDTLDLDVNTWSIKEPGKTELKDKLKSPFSRSDAEDGRTYVLGTDHLGRDILAQLWAGSSISLTIGFLAVGISVLLGVAMGGIAGYFGRARVRLPLLVSLLSALIGAISLVAEAPVAGRFFLGLAALLMILQAVVALLGRRYRPVIAFAAAVVVALGVYLYNSRIESATPEGRQLQHARKLAEVSKDILLLTRDLGHERRKAENGLPGRQSDEWLLRKQVELEIAYRRMAFAEHRLKLNKYLTGLEIDQRSASELLERAELLRKHADAAIASTKAPEGTPEQKLQQKHAGRLKTAAEHERDGRRGLARAERVNAAHEPLLAQAEDLLTQAEEAIRVPEGFDYTSSDAALALMRDTHRALLLTEYIREVLRYAELMAAAGVEPGITLEAEPQDEVAVAVAMQERAKARTTALEALVSAAPEGSEAEKAAKSELQAQLSDARRAATVAESLKKLAETRAKVTESSNAIRATLALAASDPQRVKLMQYDYGIRDVTERDPLMFAPESSNMLLNRRAQMRANYLKIYEAEAASLFDGTTGIVKLRKMNGELRYGTYRLTRHFLTITLLAILLAGTGLAMAGAAQGAINELRSPITRVFVPTITVDDLVMRFTEIMMTIPVIFLILAVLALFERDVYIVMGVIGLTSWMGTTRFVRAEILSLREQDFVQAARALGVSDFRIIWRHLVPNAISPVLVSATIGVAGAVLAESTLSFLGIGAGPDQHTWGQILSNGRAYIADAPWMTWIPGIAILITVLSFNLLGEGLREAFNPKLRGR